VLAILYRGLWLLLLPVLAACTEMPRGAAIESEILADAELAAPTFQLVRVTRATVPALRGWPEPDGQGGNGWIDASRGPLSPVIREGDRVDLTIWDSQANSLITGPTSNVVTMPELAVSADGAIFVPYVGDIVIRGMTPESSRQEIQTRLAPIAPDAQVQLSLASGVQNSVSFVAGVASPGTYPLPDRNTSLLGALALAGGVDSGLRNPTIALVRGSATYRIPADALYASAGRNTRLQGGDKIIVQDDDRSFTALGASGVENLVYFPKTDLTALEAISLMGGVDARRADPRAILVLREFEPARLNATASGPTHEDVIFAIDMTTADGLFAARNFAIRPGDTILATESQITNLSTLLTLVGQTFGLTTSITAVAQ